MRKTLLTLTAAAAIGTAGMSSMPTPANAVAWWVAPVIIGAAVGGTALVATSAANAQGYYAEPGPGSVYVRPTASAPQCFWARERVAGGWRRIQVCN
jgi:hypothetical protein